MPTAIRLRGGFAPDLRGQRHMSGSAGSGANECRFDRHCGGVLPVREAGGVLRSPDHRMSSATDSPASRSMVKETMNARRSSAAGNGTHRMPRQSMRRHPRSRRQPLRHGGGMSGSPSAATAPWRGMKVAKWAHRASPDFFCDADRCRCILLLAGQQSLFWEQFLFRRRPLRSLRRMRKRTLQSV